MIHPLDPISIKFAKIILGQSESTAKRKMKKARIKEGKLDDEDLTIKEFCRANGKDLPYAMEKINKEIQFSKL